MKSFLEEVAEQLYNKYGQSISGLTMLFPSQRARLFFSEALLSVAQRPIWAPHFVTVDELMSQISGLYAADRLRLIAELYAIYSKYHTEDFDHFYHWGEMLIADFDMIDKYQINAEHLFANIADMKELESDVDYLSESQLKTIRQFWNTLGSGESLSNQKEKFLKIWRSLATIYNEYKEHLTCLGIGYTGMIYRKAAEVIAQSTAPLLADDKYVVVGFNALCSCEVKLFEYLKSVYNTEFFWDYSDYYFNNRIEEAGRFVRSNVAAFPSDSPVSHRDLRETITELNVVSTATSVAQCSYLVEILKDIAGTDENGRIKPLDRDTAIVLTDENLLMPLLYALPEELKNDRLGEAGGVNVTMGYPLRQTLAYSFVERLIELQHHARQSNGETTFYYVDVDGLLTHPYIVEQASDSIASIRKQIVEQRIFNVPYSLLSTLPFASNLFCVVDGATGLMRYIDSVLTMVIDTFIDTFDTKWRIEYLLQSRESLRKLENMIGQCHIEMSSSICRQLIRRHLQSVRIPFEGEPLEGLQVMGILETRNLDFKNVIVLSMSDSNFPGTKVSQGSFIPYNLRFAYGLPTVEHHEGVYAYYFYRLIQRAERVWLVYASQSDEKGSGEPSRYIRQLEYESSLPINFTKVAVELNLVENGKIEIAKDSAIMAELGRYTSKEKPLSPTAFSTFVQCPLRFYFKYIAKIKADEPLEEGMDDKTFGNIFHRAAEILYSDMVGQGNVAYLLSQKSRAEIEKTVDQAISEVYFNGKEVQEDNLRGELSIIRQIVIRYLADNLVGYDIVHSNFIVEALESVFDKEFSFESANKQLSILFEGRADRVDSLDNGQLRIIDYKTGGAHLLFPGFDRLFNGKSADRVSNTINTLIYSMIEYYKTGRDVQPALYYLRDMYNKEYSPLLKQGQGISKKSIPVESYSAIAEPFEREVFNALSCLFDPAQPFTQVEDIHACQYCDYKLICARNGDER